MKVLMFRNQWIEQIKAGRKVQTVRPPRKKPISAGDALSLRVWTGRPYASKQETILETHCTSVASVTIDDGGIVIDKKEASGNGYVTIDYVLWRLTTEECETIAKRDGFDSLKAMQDFFREMHGLPFSGTVIGWD